MLTAARRLVATIAGPSIVTALEGHSRSRNLRVRRTSQVCPLRSPMEESWTPDALAIGSRAGYLWCADGVLDSKLSKAFARRGGETVTTRNWATVLKLHVASNWGVRTWPE